jgi:PPM family protein phosphatase
MDSEAWKEVMQGAIQEANQEVVALSQEIAGLKGMGTTATAVVTRTDKFYVAHIGDSRAYLIRNRRIDQVSEDHSIVAQLLKARAITPEEALKHPYRNVITRCIGMQAQV